MTKSAQIRARIEPEIKDKAEAVFKSLGISTSEAISIFLNQVIYKQGFPFSVNIPNDETREAIQQVQAGNTTVVTLAELAEQFNLTTDERNKTNR